MSMNPPYRYPQIEASFMNGVLASQKSFGTSSNYPLHHVFRT